MLVLKVLLGGNVNADERLPNRWLIAVMGTVLQMFLGTAYAWSFFQKPLTEAYHWTNSEAALAFSIAIFCLGISAAWGGINLPKYGPKKLAMSGGVLFGVGYLLAALALYQQSIALLYIGYGVVGGIGLGLGYVTPVATVAKWHPDRKGLVTGMVIMGFGFGALLMSKIFAPFLMQMTVSADAPMGDMVRIFAYLGVFFGVVTLFAGSFLKNPPAGYAPQGWKPATPVANTQKTDEKGSAIGSLLTGRFALMWLVFFCNIVAGIAIIGFQSPLIQDLWKRKDSALDVSTLAQYGATLIAISSLFNGLGRMFWGGVSDKIGRIQTFRIMLGTQVVAFMLLSKVSNPWIFQVLVCYVLLCYGGGFGTMPSFVTDVFGQKMMATVYGCILTAWSMGGLVGPQVVAVLKDYCKAHNMESEAASYSFLLGAGFLTVGFIASLALTRKMLKIAAVVESVSELKEDAAVGRETA